MTLTSLHLEVLPGEMRCAVPAHVDNACIEWRSALNAAATREAGGGGGGGGVGGGRGEGGGMPNPLARPPGGDDENAGGDDDDDAPRFGAGGLVPSYLLSLPSDSVLMRGAGVFPGCAALLFQPPRPSGASKQAILPTHAPFLPLGTPPPSPPSLPLPAAPPGPLRQQAIHPFFESDDVHLYQEPACAVCSAACAHSARSHDSTLASALTREYVPTLWSPGQVSAGSQYTAKLESHRSLRWDRAQSDSRARPLWEEEWQSVLERGRNS